MKHGQLPQINVVGMKEQVVGKNSLYLSCSRQQPCQSEVPGMQQLSREIIIEHDLLLHFNTKELCTVSVSDVFLVSQSPCEKIECTKTHTFNLTYL